MNKTIGLAALSVCSLILASFAVLQQFVIEEQDTAFRSQFVSLNEVRETLGNSQIAYNELREEYDKLGDSLRFYKHRVTELELLTISLQENIDVLSGKTNRREKKFDKLEKEIEKLKKDKEKNAGEIQELEEEKTKLLRQMHELQTEKEKREAALKQYEEEKMAARVEESRLAEINKIINETWVSFNDVKLTKKESGPTLDKVGKGESRWRYTAVTFSLTHTLDELLIDKKFILKIVDTDSGQIIPFLEKNPQFPDSDINLTGVEFMFEDNPVKVVHINTQEKSGQNYEVRIYYLASDGKEHLLRNGVRPIIQSGKPFSL